MTNEDPNANPKQDWSVLAKEALDLWQNHLTSLATDPSAKDEMARFVAPMSQMFTQWTSMMQQGLQGMMHATTQQQPDQSTEQPVDERAGEASDEPTAEPILATDESGRDEPIVSGAALDDASDDGDDRAIVGAAPEPQPEPAPERAAEPQAAPAARGRTAAPDGSRDLAQLASRLAQLERELDSLRPKPRKSDAAGDAAASGDVQQVAGADPLKDSA